MPVLKYFDATSSTWEDVIDVGPQGAPGATGPIGPAGYTPPISEAPFIQRSGDAMTGMLALATDPVSSAQAATKQYVDGGGKPNSSVWGPFGDLDVPSDTYIWPPLKVKGGSGLAISTYGGHPSIMLNRTGFYFMVVNSAYDPPHPPASRQVLMIQHNDALIAVTDQPMETQHGLICTSALFWGVRGDHAHTYLWHNGGTVALLRPLNQNYAVRFLGENL